jgi:phage-related protein
VRFKEAVYVLHAFQKKSKRGIATPKREIELIGSRLKDAESYHGEWLKEREP